MLPKGPRPVKHRLDERVAEARARLAPSERAVAAFFVEHRDEASFLPAAEIARRLGVSNATVIRTAQALGYRGLPDLRRELGESLRARANAIGRLGKSLDALAGGDLLDHFLADQIAILEEARHSIAPKDHAAAVALLASAERVLVYAMGPLAGLAEYFVRTLRRFGWSALVMSERGMGVADELMELRRGDVLLMVAFERVVPDVEVALDAAKERGVKSVLLTDSLGLALRGRYSIGLAVKRGEAGGFPLVAVVVAVLESLLMGIAGQERTRTVAALQRLDALRREIGEG
ncbi:MAG: MurR/RpiR family transcriptional regulator [Chloroflexi bacterium]|nr:MurR/RpiR family transcriptional regulator [Chloroflexota bacterium]